MEYHPRYPQPFSLAQAIALDPAVAWDEIARLNNSLIHLKRTQDELEEYLRGLAPEEDPEVSQAVKENEIAIASQDERIFMLKLALAHHGHAVASGQTSGSLASAPLQGGTARRPQNTISSGSNGLDDAPSARRTPVENPGTRRVQQEQGGVYL